MKKKNMDALVKELSDWVESFKRNTNRLKEVKTGDLKRFLPRRLSKSKRSEYEKELENMRGAYESMLKGIDSHIRGLEETISSISSLSWDSLNVGFFGETNVGKSTLIEAILGGDGRSIGEGIKDFTKQVSSYDFGEEIRLLDMPGIEGNEKEVIKEIEKAVRESHIVFYIFRDSKEPERGTLEKVKRFLSDNAYVYGIINLSGLPRPGALDKQKDKLETVRKRSENRLREVFGDRFKGMLVVHTLYGFFARTKNPISENLIRKREKALKWYRSEEELLRVSGIEGVIEAIREGNKNKNIVIFWSNLRKILHTQERIISKILSYKKKNLDHLIKQIEDEFSSLREKFEKDKRVLRNNIKQIIKKKFEKLEAELKEIVSRSIEEGEKDSIWEKEVEALQKRINREIEEEIKKEIEDFQKRFKENLKVLEKKIKLAGDFISDLGVGVPKLGFMYYFKKIGKEIIDTVFSVIGVLAVFAWNPIVGIIAGAVVLVRKIWDWFFKSNWEIKQEKKRKAFSEIERQMNKTRKEADRKLKEVFSNIDKEFKEIEEKIEFTRRSFKAMSRYIDEVVRDLMIDQHRTAEVFGKFLGGVEFLYVQTSLKEGDSVAVVSKDGNHLRDKLSLCGIKNIYIYPSYETMVVDAENRKTEFFKRLRNITELLNER